MDQLDLLSSVVCGQLSGLSLHPVMLRFGLFLCIVMLNTGPQGLVAPRDKRILQIHKVMLCDLVSQVILMNKDAYSLKLCQRKIGRGFSS